ncbi:hypothetical protein GY15_13165 [Delftia sp. 670]|nr:hypothetical protein GY15_13165 [Delftia sp. 670]
MVFHNLLRCKLGGVGTSMSIRNKDGIKAQIASDPAIGVHAVLSLHAGDDQAGHVACLKLLQQIGACKGAWAVFFEHNLTAVQLQFGCELGQWAAWANGRSHGTDVTSQKNWRSRTAGLCHQGVDGVQHLGAAPHGFRASDQADLNIED